MQIGRMRTRGARPSSGYWAKFHPRSGGVWPEWPSVGRARHALLWDGRMGASGGRCLSGLT